MNTPDEMRKYLGMMRDPNSNKRTNESKPNKNMDIRDMLGKMRSAKKLHENVLGANKKTLNEAIETTAIDQRQQEEKMFNFFGDNNLVIDFQPLGVEDNGVWWGGTLNKTIDWVFWVSNDQNLNKIIINNVEITDLDAFNADDSKIRQITDRLEGDNVPSERAEELVRKIIAYYQEFSNYWIENHLQK